jgi:SAM-dependent methyltransferase
MISDKLLYDDRYGFPGEFGLYYCTNCRHLALDMQMTAGQLTDLYTNYYPQSEMDVTAWAPQKEGSSLLRWWHGLGSSAFRWGPLNVRVLDISCGFGQSLGYHRERGCDARGVELNGNIRRVAERYDLNVKPAQAGSVMHL